MENAGREGVSNAYLLEDGLELGLQVVQSVESCGMVSNVVKVDDGIKRRGDVYSTGQ